MDIGERRALQVPAGDVGALARSAKEELIGNLLPFWRSVADPETGTIAGLVSALGVRDEDAPLSTVYVTRLLYAFSESYERLREPDLAKRAELLGRRLVRHHWDAEHGGAYWSVAADGTPLETDKHLYAQAFVIYAAATAARVFKNDALKNLAERTFRLVHVKAHDKVHGGYAEAFDRAWQPVANTRMAVPGSSGPKSVNVHMHMLEAVMALAGVSQMVQVRQAMSHLCKLFPLRMISPETGHTNSCFSTDWRPAGEVLCYGHDLGLAWLLVGAAEQLGDTELQTAIASAARRLIAASVAGGQADDGGIAFMNAAGHTDSLRYWWVQAEAVIALLQLAELNLRETGCPGDALDQAMAVWRFILRYHSEPRVGEWIERVDNRGTPDRAALRAGPWKGPYHSVRCCLEILARTERIRRLQIEAVTAEGERRRPLPEDSAYAVIAAECRAGRFAEAAEIAKAVRRAEPDSPWAIAAMAMICRERGQYADACRWADAAIRQDSQAGIGYAEAGLALFGQGRLSEAEPALSTGVSLGLPRDHPARLALCETLIETAGPDRALSRLEGHAWSAAEREDAAALAHFARTMRDVATNLIDPGGGDRSWSHDRTVAYARSCAWQIYEAVRIKRHDAAAALARRGLRIAPSDADLLGAVALQHAAALRFDDADRLLGEAAYQEPSQPDRLQKTAALLAYSRRRFDEVVAILNDVTPESGRATLVQAILADAHRRLGDSVQAGRLARESLAGDPKSALARVVLWRLVAHESGADPLEQARRFDRQRPDQAPVLFYLADRLWPEDPVAAEAMARRGIAIEPLLPDARDWAERLDVPLDPEAGTQDPLQAVGVVTPRSDEGSAWPTESQTALVRLCFAPPERRAGAWAAWCRGTDFDVLDSGTYRLLPFAYRRIVESGETIARQPLLAGVWRKSCFETLTRWRPILPAMDRLREAAIPVMLLKGGLLARNVYRDWGSRPMADIDILVAPDRLSEALDILLEDGWTSRHPLENRDYRLHYCRLQYAVTLKKPSGAMLDLHWQPDRAMMSADCPGDLFWQEAESCTLFDRLFFAPEPALQLLHGLVHGLRWNAVAPVRWVPDTVLLLQAFGTRIDWPRLIDLAGQAGLISPMQAGLGFLAEHFPELAPLIADTGVPGATPTETDRLLFRIGQRPPREPANHAEMMAVLQFWRRSLVDHEDSCQPVLIGGTQPDVTAAWARREGIPFAHDYDRSTVTELLEKSGKTVAYCINGHMNASVIGLIHLDIAGRPETVAQDAADAHPIVSSLGRDA